MLKLIILIIFIPLITISQPYINKIYINNGEVFDSTKSEWFWGASLLNSLHFTTNSYIIEDQLLFKEGDEIDEDLIYETERNLRDLKVFTDVLIEFDSVSYDSYDIIIHTQDRWSTSPVILYGTDGGVREYGGKISEKNFLGNAIDMEFEYLNRAENDIGDQGRYYMKYPYIFRSPMVMEFEVLGNKIRTEQYFNFLKPFKSLDATASYGFLYKNNFGSTFFYNNTNDNFSLIGIKEQVGKIYFSRAWRDIDRVFFSSSIEFDKTNRGEISANRAFDNTAKFLISFSSVSENYEPLTKLNTYFDEDLPLGGYGEVVLGKTFKLADDGDSLWYIGGRGEKSYFWGNMYLYGMIMGGSGFSTGINRFRKTYQEFLGLGFYRFNDDLLLSSRIRQQTSWNWGSDDRQLVLDSDSGIRGIQANNFNGDNRIVSNIELRYFPTWSFWVFDLSGAAFFDIGTVWDRDQGFVNSIFQKTAGIGFRIHNQKISGPNGIFRIDFAYDFNRKNFASIIFTTDQLFSIFKRHEYRIPEIYGLEYDVE